VQFAISGTIILTGISMGIGAVVSAGAPHPNDVHKVHTYLHFYRLILNPLQRWGVALFMLYLAQCGLGTFFHWVKPTVPRGRPLQNWPHVAMPATVL
jgi:hypothetical protein